MQLTELAKLSLAYSGAYGDGLASSAVTLSLSTRF
jgi:hypothetical protein